MGSLSLKPSSSSTPWVAGRERSLIPVGMSTILPDAARRIRHLEQTLLAVLARGGYEEIILPMFEYLDVLAPGLESELLEKCYQLVDRTTGRLMLLRPDATAQIARTPIPKCRAAITSGRIDMPTTSTPWLRSERISAGVS